MRILTMNKKLYIISLLGVVISSVGIFVTNFKLDSGLSRRYSYLAILIMGVCFCIFNFSRISCYHRVDQITFISILIGVTLFLFSIINYKYFVNNSTGAYIYFIIFLSLIFIGVGNYNLWYMRKIFSFDFLKFKEKIPILFVIFSLFLLSMIDYDIQPRWDGMDVYKSLALVKPEELFSIRANSICGHMAQMYGIINTVFRFIFRRLELSLLALNIALYLVSIYSMYSLLELFLIKTSKCEKIIYTLIYVVSPFVMGLSHYAIWDVWLIYLIPILSVCYFKNLKIYFALIALIISLTKETGIIFLGGFFLGICIIDIIYKRKSLRDIIKSQYLCVLFCLSG